MASVASSGKSFYSIVLFNSWEFLILLITTAVLYYLPLGGRRQRVWQVGLLLVASALFYSWENPKLLVLLSVSCVMNSLGAERILFWKSRAGAQQDEDQGSGGSGSASVAQLKAKRWLFWTVSINLLLLAFFKYAGFFAGLFPQEWVGSGVLKWIQDIPLPVGISFYTFQGISLVVDAWRRDISPQSSKLLAKRGAERISSVRDLSFYISFFPQLVAGPIVKAREFIDQIGAKRFVDIDWLTVRRGLVIGYFLKIFVADNLAEATTRLTLGAERIANGGPLTLLPLLYGYCLQIFADFAGYSLIAIGLGALFGYRLPPNFNFPYLSTSITEFWRRWHLSLSSWLREYLYIPLGGNRLGSGRTYFNLFLVMFLGGLWHGAAWKFAVWGTAHGVFLAIERLFSRRAKVNQADAADESKFSILRASIVVVRWAVTFNIVTFLWLTFMMPDIASIKAFFSAISSGNLGFSGPPIFSLLFYGSAVVLYHVWGWVAEHRKPIAQKLRNSPMEAMVHGLMVFLVVTNPGAPRGFIYFQF